MNFTDITTWSVSKGVATPVNPFNKTQSTTKDNGDWYHEHNPDYNDFEQFAQQHTYATNAPDGSYSADRFGEIVWQYEIENEKDFWFEYGDKCAFSGDFEKYKAYMIDEEIETRQFLPFINQVKEAESPKFVEAEIQCQNKQQDIEIGFVRAEALKEVCKVYGDDFINENIQAASALIEMYIKGYVLSKIGLPSPPKTL